MSTYQRQSSADTFEDHTDDIFQERRREDRSQVEEEQRPHPFVGEYVQHHNINEPYFSADTTLTFEHSSHPYTFHHDTTDLEPASQLFHDNNCPQLNSPPLPPVFRHACKEKWTWNALDKSHEVKVCGPGQRTAFFHPNWSNGTAGVRGSRPLNGGIHFWEIRVSSRVFGTSMMFGVATRRARLHVDAFLNLIGEDDQSWGLSHKGLLWHGARSMPYALPFKENVATTIGVLFDGIQGTLAFYKDGEYLGPAFSSLDLTRNDLFPVVCSTAAKTEMTLGKRRRAYVSLQDRCRAVILECLNISGNIHAAYRLPLPNPLRQFIDQAAR